VQGFDRYAYVNNNPVNYTDPSGHAVSCEQGDFCDHGYPNPPLNPWRQSPDQSAIGRDRAAGLNEDYDQLFLNHAFSPVRNRVYRGFGGCSTYTLCNGEYHPAIDTPPYYYPAGTSIYAMAYGKVVAIGFEDYGHFVMIEHCITTGNCVYSVYAHLQAGSIIVNVGDIVGPNTQIAGMGGSIDADSGGLTFIHLHLEVRRASNVLLNNPKSPVSAGFDENGNYIALHWWVKSLIELNTFFVDLGPLLGYNKEYCLMLKQNENCS